MSLARIYTTQKSRKVWTCSKCRTDLPVGSKVLSFSVGFRGVEQKRCADKPSCAPTRAELESSQVATVYGAMDGIDWSSRETLDDLESAVQEVADACREVADEYESNEMYEINEQLQERASTLNDAADTLEGQDWKDGLDDEPVLEDYPVDAHAQDLPESSEEEYDEDAFNDAHDEWLEAARTAAESFVNDVELP